MELYNIIIRKNDDYECICMDDNGSVIQTIHVNYQRTHKNMKSENQRIWLNE